MSDALELTPEETAAIKWEREAKARAEGAIVKADPEGGEAPGLAVLRGGEVLALQRALLNPTAGRIADTGPAEPLYAGKPVAEVGQVGYRVTNHNTGSTSVHYTLQAAKRAALAEGESAHWGSDPDARNTATVDISVVLLVGVKDLMAAKGAAIEVEPFPGLR